MIKSKVLMLMVLLGTAFSLGAAQSGLPVFAFDSYDKWGYCYQGTDFVSPCYENVVALGPYRAAFWARQDSAWGLRRLDNSEIIPFVFEDVCVASQYQPYNIPIQLDSIELYDQGVILPAITYDRHYYYRFPAEVNILFPLLPVKKGGKWGYVNFKGEEIIPFDYDEAFIFTLWLSKDKKRQNWIAEVRKGEQSAWIDILGRVIIPWQKHKVFSAKEAKSYIKKRKKEETRLYNSKIDVLESQMDSSLVIRDYVNQCSAEIQVVEVRQKKAKSRSKRKAKTETEGKTRYMILYADNTPVVPDTVDFVFEREGDALRVKIGDKMRAINLNTGWLPFPAYDSIAPFNSKGKAMAWTGNEEYCIGLNGAWSSNNHSYRKFFSEIRSAVGKREWKEAAKIASSFSYVMPYYGSPCYRIACDATIRNAVNNYNYYNDPKLIAERERIKAEKAQESKSLWYFLGDLVSTAGSFSNSSTSQGLKALGESIKVVADPDASEAEATDNYNSNVVTATETKDVSVLQAQISAIDQELDQISNRQAELARERLQAHSQTRSSGVLGAKTQTGSNATRNFSASRTRQRAQQRANAQTSSRNRLSSIDTQIEALKDRKTELLTKRSQLNKQLEQLTYASDDSYSSHSSSSGKGKSGEQNKSINTRIYSSSQRTLNSIGRQLSELHVKYEDPTQVFTASDRSRVKSLQAEAKQVRKNCLEQTGQTLPANSLENWNP